MKNPPKKPQAPPGFQAVWIKPAQGAIFGTFFDETIGRWVYGGWMPVTIRRGHWRLAPVSLDAQEARRKKSEWIPVHAFERELRARYDLAGADPIYRHNRTKDVVKALSHSSADPLHGLVWGQPVGNLKGSYKAIRLWYIVRDENLDRHYLYGRTASVGGVVLTNLTQAADEVGKLEEAVRDEYKNKAYMEYVRFVSWTAYGRADAVKDHRKFLKQSKERGFDYDERRRKFFRKDTTWERSQAQKALRGVSGIPKVLARDFGGSYRRFKDAVANLSKSEKREVYETLSWAIRKMEKELDRRRRARK